MAVKYHCRKCGKRFVEWGAEKLGFKCPDCEGEDLVRVGLSDEKGARRPSLKRKGRRPVPVVSVAEDDLIAPDIEEVETEEIEGEAPQTVFIADDDEGPQADLDLAEVLPAAEVVEAEPADLEVPEDVGFGEVTPPVEDNGLHEPLVDNGEWLE
jgi:DNA-directed RNA polymerase subunit RPC12/RpoP